MDNIGGFSQIEIIPVSAILVSGVVDDKAFFLRGSGTSWLPMVTPESISVSHNVELGAAVSENSIVGSARIPSFSLTDFDKAIGFGLSGRSCVAVFTAINGVKWLLGSKMCPLTLLTKQLLPGEAAGYTGIEINLSCKTSFNVLQLVAF